MKTAPPDRPAWPIVANVLLGLWLMGAAPALGVMKPALLWSDLVSGATAVVFSLLALRHAWTAWVVGGVGLWVMSAPLLFSAPNAAVYSNGRLHPGKRQ